MSLATSADLSKIVLAATVGTGTSLAVRSGGAWNAVPIGPSRATPWTGVAPSGGAWALCRTSTSFTANPAGYALFVEPP
jgi:hypothetical protein